MQRFPEQFIFVKLSDFLLRSVKNPVEQLQPKITIKPTPIECLGCSSNQLCGFSYNSEEKKATVYQFCVSDQVDITESFFYLEPVSDNNYLNLKVLLEAMLQGEEVSGELEGDYYFADLFIEILEALVIKSKSAHKSKDNESMCKIQVE